ncbi:unnamed protein product [Mytilus edulis]|uniref:2'-5'-oligoadenylate synthetase 1 domain-containing protein n=1 Tax=Mytilus edulis TaxID=6550 RepID=A0A8S3VLL0_MYTED|nr:unnamed protein product [Mytilus edulis]
MFAYCLKGGSVGKGTAVLGLSDVDLIFPIYDITTVETLKQKMDDIKSAIDSLLQDKLLLQFFYKDKKNSLLVTSVLAEHTIIKSIAVELLVIRSWEDLEKPDSDSEEKISKKVFEHLRNFGKIHVSWSTYYKPADYLHDISSKPYILDPVDPYNNVISEITNHYCGGSHVPEADKAVMKQVNRLQSDAERAFNSFK